jgi:NAD(P)-dependent dehydrogenase (short-subunit alcohol dehydrogenase family)
MTILHRFRLDGKVALLTGAAGVLGAACARALAEAGAKVWVSDLREGVAKALVDELRRDDLQATGLCIDVLNRTQLEVARGVVGDIDILVNLAGGNLERATTSADRPFFDLPLDALKQVVDLNLFGGAILPSQVFGRQMAERESGAVIVNIASMGALRPLTRVPGYSCAKAAVSNFTRWLAVHMAQEYDPRIRVNAIAPGFFVTEQNRFLLTDPDTSELTERGRIIIRHTPMNRFGVAEDLGGAIVWLCSDAAAFVTGVVLPVDGGFSAFSGV